MSRSTSKTALTYDRRKRLWRVRVGRRIVGFYPRHIAEIVLDVYRVKR